jgi:hypothetical protein
MLITFHWIFSMESTEDLSEDAEHADRSSICFIYTWLNDSEYFVMKYPEGPTMKGHIIGHSNQKYICSCVLFRTVSEIELFHCTVVWIWRPILSFPRACEPVWSVSWPLWLLMLSSTSCEQLGIGHVYMYSFCLEWPILWPPTILTSPPGTSWIASNDKCLMNVDLERMWEEVVVA